MGACCRGDGPVWKCQAERTETKPLWFAHKARVQTTLFGSNTAFGRGGSNFVVGKGCERRVVPPGTKDGATEVKQMIAVKTAFLPLTNTKTWEEAEEKYPTFSCESQLHNFIRPDLSKSIPWCFTNFCTRAKLSEGQTNSAVAERILIQHSSFAAYVVE